MDQGQRASPSLLWLNPISGTGDTTSLSHGEAEARHRDAHVRCLAAGWIEAAEYHAGVADWHGASGT